MFTVHSTEKKEYDLMKTGDLRACLSVLVTNLPSNHRAIVPTRDAEAVSQHGGWDTGIATNGIITFWKRKRKGH